MKNIVFFITLISLFLSINAQSAEWVAYGGVPNAATRASVIDASGNKWVAMFGGGVSKFMPDENWINYTSSNSGMPENYALCVTIDNTGKKWIGTNSSGAVSYDGVTWTTYNTSSGLPGNQINCIAVDPSNNKWFGVNMQGVSMYNGTSFTNYSTSNSSLPNNNVNCITIDASGNKWIGTYGGLAKFNGSTWTVYTSATSGLAHDQVYSVTVESPTVIWIGTAGGLCKFDGGSSWTTFHSGNSSLPYNYVNCVAIDQNNMKWIGTTQGGMAKFDGASAWTIFNTSNSDIPGLNIKHISVDGNNNLWICSNGGFAFYGIIVVVNPADASLSDLQVGGTTVAGFSSTVYSYNVSLPYGTSTPPPLTATTTNPNATKVITNATTIPGASTVVVTSQDASTTQTYTVNFTAAAPSSDATLSTLLVNGTQVAGFSSSTLLYNVTLPYGTSVMPVVTAVTNDITATKVITNVTSLPGSATVVVTAQNGTTTQTYAVNFSLTAPSADATLSALNVDGVLISGFSPTTYSYSIELPYGTTVIPQLTATTTSPVATKLITNTTVLPGASTVVVTAQNTTTTQTYTVNFTLATPSADASLSALNIDGVLISGFSPTTYSYSIELPYGTTVIPQLTATTTSPVATKLITNTTVLPGASTVVVTAQNTTTTQTYTVNFTLAAPSADATLSALNVDGNLINGFSPSVYSYAIELPFGTTAVPVLTATTNDINATKVISNISALPGTSTVIVTAQDGNATNTYSVEFTVAAAGADATLATMLYGGTAVPGFSSINFEYNIELPQGTTLVPALSGTTSDADATMVIADAAALPGSSTITVTAQNTVTVNVYTVHFTVLTHVDGVLIAPISIYPIPAQNTITVDSEADLTVVLTDALGKVLVTKNITASDNQVDVSALPDGIYFLRTGDNPEVTKIIKLNR